MQWGRIPCYEAMELNPTVYGIWRAHERASADIGLLRSSANVDGNKQSLMTFEATLSLLMWKASRHALVKGYEITAATRSNICNALGCQLRDSLGAFRSSAQYQLPRECVTIYGRLLFPVASI
jgi:hypothetical protein